MELGKFREAQRLAFEAIAVLASLYLVQMIFFPWDDKTQLFPKFRTSSEKEKKKIDNKCDILSCLILARLIS